MKCSHHSATVKVTIAVLVLVFSHALFSQEFSAGLNIETPNPNAVLHLVSPNNNQGLLIPQLTTLERTSMTLDTDDEGLLVFDEEDQRFYFWTSVGWIVLNTENSAALTTVAIDGTLVGDGTVGNELGVNAGIGANQLVQLDTDSKLPALDGSNLINLNDGDNDPTNEIELPATAATGQVLAFDGATWVAGNAATGDMTKSVYDGDDDGIVDEAGDAELVNGLTVETSVPVSAVFTDNQNAAEVRVAAAGNLTSTDVQAALEELQLDIDATGGDMTQAVYDGNSDGAVDVAEDAATVNGLTVETAVPVGAVFTDTQLSDADISSLGYIKDPTDGDSDATNEIELPATAISGQVLKYDGTDWVAGTDDGLSNISGFSTDDLVEGTTNLYYTNARADARIGAASVTSLTDVTSAGSGQIITGAERTQITTNATSISGLGTASTQDVGTGVGNVLQFAIAGQLPTLDGSNLTNIVATSLGTLDTDDLTEGTTNLYYTNARADARIAAASVTTLTDVTSAGSGQIITGAERTQITTNATSISGLGTASTQDVGTGVGNVLQFATAGQLPTLDGSNLTNIVATSLGTLDTDDLTEGTTNLYYTNARADARIAAASVTTLTDVTSAGSGQIITGAERTQITTNATNIAGLGTASTQDVGTGVGNVLQFATAGQLPTLDGSNLTNIVATSLGTLDTDDLTEGTTNLYYTNARADARIAAASVTTLTDVTSAGSGQIITGAERTQITTNATNIAGLGTASAQDVGTGVGNVLQFATAGQLPTLDGSNLTNIVATSLGTLDTDDLTEGTTNLYYTNARADARIAAASVTTLTDVTSAGSGQIITGAERTQITTNATNIAGLGTASAQDVGTGVGNVLQFATAGQLPTLDGSNLTNIVATSLGTLDTDDLTEGTTNLYYTNARADARFAAASVTSLTDVTSAGSGQIITGAERTQITTNATNIAGLGTASTQDVGTGVGNVLQFATAGELPALDAANLTSLNADELNTSTVPVAGDVMTWDNVNGRWDASFLKPGLWDENAGDISYSSGFVGIGTVNPRREFHLDGPSGGISFQMTNMASGNADNVSGFVIDYNDGGTQEVDFIHYEGFNFRFGDGGGINFTVDNQNNRVSIGNAPGPGKLAVVADAADPIARFDKPSAVTGSGIWIDMNDAVSAGRPAIVINDALIPIQIPGVADSDGRILVSDASGNMTLEKGFGRRFETTNYIAVNAGGAAAIATGAVNNIIMGGTAGQLLTTGDDNIAIGAVSLPAVTTGSGNISIGSNSGGGTLATGTGNVLIGQGAIVDGGNPATSDNIAIGTGTTVQNANTVAIGSAASSVVPGGIAIGNTAGATASASNGVAIGSTATATQTNSIAIGNTAASNGSNSIAIGTTTNNNGAAQAVAIGNNANSLDDGGVAVGTGTNAGNGASAIGAGATAPGAGSIAIGASNANGTNTVVLGSGTIAGGNDGIALGSNTTVDGDNSVAIGNTAYVGNSTTGSVAIGLVSAVQDGSTGSIAILGQVNAALDNAIAIGNSSVASATGGVSIGLNTNTAANGVAFGNGATGLATGATALGTGATANGASSIALGSSTSSAANSISIGTGSQVSNSSNNGVAIGPGAIADATGAVAIGTNANSSRVNTVTLGSPGQRYDLAVSGMIYSPPTTITVDPGGVTITPTSRIVFITGGGPIDGFGTGVDGQEVILVGSAGVGVGLNLGIPNTALNPIIGNFFFSPGSSIHLVYISTLGWVEISRSET